MGYLMDLRKKVGSIPLVVAGVAVIIHHEEKILLIERHDNGLWGMPAGSIELHESPAEAAIREVYEETGLTIKKEDLRLLNVYGGPDFFYTYPNGDQCSNVATSYVAERFSGDLITETDETINAKFFPYKDLPRNIEKHEMIMINYFIEECKK